MCTINGKTFHVSSCIYIYIYIFICCCFIFIGKNASICVFTDRRIGKDYRHTVCMIVIHICENNSNLRLLEMWRERTSEDRNFCGHIFVICWRTYTHFCPVTRRTTCCLHIPYHLSILSRVECDNQKMNVLNFESKGTIKFSEKEENEEGERVDFANSQCNTDHASCRRSRLSVLHRTHGFYLWSFHCKLTRHCILLISLFVCDIQYR